MPDEGAGGGPHDGRTKGVETLLGDPRKAVLVLAIPTILAMSVTTIYNLVDAIWVSGLGADALSALGFFFPFMFMALALATGLGVGGGAAISRRIGAQDKAGADSVATHSIVLLLILSGGFALPLYVFAPNIFGAIGAGRTAPLATTYARVMFSGTTLIFFSNVATALLRSEGDANRAMKAMITGAVINIILDPIFIYTLGLGVGGAAAASVLSMGVSSSIMFYWLILGKVTYISTKFRGFRFDGAIMKDIFRVGLPASVQHVSMSTMMIVMNLIIVGVGGTDGVAVFSTGWRVASMAILPLLGIATAVVAVGGAAFGARDYEKLDATHKYALRLGLMVEVSIALTTLVLAPQIAAVFTQSEGAARIAGDLTTFLRVITIFYPAVAFGMLSSSLFQGTGKGIYALIITLIRTIVLGPPIAWAFGVALDFGLVGIWFGMVLGNILGALLAYAWARRFVGRLRSAEPSVAETRVY